MRPGLSLLVCRELGNFVRVWRGKMTNDKRQQMSKERLNDEIPKVHRTERERKKFSGGIFLSCHSVSKRVQSVSKRGGRMALDCWDGSGRDAAEFRRAERRSLGCVACACTQFFRSMLICGEVRIRFRTPAFAQLSIRYHGSVKISTGICIFRRQAAPAEI